MIRFEQHFTNNISNIVVFNVLVDETDIQNQSHESKFK
jgi:hypothetical protein